MADSTQQTDETTETEGQESTGAETSEGNGGDEKGAEAPPWGDDFDPARAWQTIQRLREIEKAHKKAEADREREAQERAEAEKSELQKITERAERAERELWTARAQAKHGIPEDLLGLLKGSSEEEVLGVAEALAAHLKKDDDSGPKRSGSSRPKPRLKPGESADSTPAPKSPDEIAKAVRNRRTY